MDSRLQPIVDHLAATRAELRAAVDRVPASARSIKPAADQWSVAEVIEHLAIIERRIIDMVANAVTKARVEGLTNEIEEDAAALNPEHLGLLRDRSRKIEARPSNQPTGNLDADAAWAELEAARAELLEALEATEGVALSALEHPHPILGPINTYQWIAFLGGHEARHAAQIDEIAQTIPIST